MGFKRNVILKKNEFSNEIRLLGKQILDQLIKK